MALPLCYYPILDSHGMFLGHCAQPGIFVDGRFVEIGSPPNADWTAGGIGITPTADILKYMYLMHLRSSVSSSSVSSNQSSQSYIMYHGTDSRAAASIRQNGFRPSSDGVLGRGVYLSTDPEKAKSYGNWIIKCRVNVGKVKVINYQGHALQTSWHENGYDTAWLPPRNDMVPSGKTEDCVYDSERIEVIDIFEA